MRVREIKVRNYKAIEEEHLVLPDGCSCLIIGPNDSGKSSLLQGLFRRFGGVIPKNPVRDGAEDGEYEITFDNNEFIRWIFSKKGKEKLYFETGNHIPKSTGVLKHIGKKYFGAQFDIDVFLSAPPKKQSKILSDLIGVDFGDVDARYDAAYSDRATARKYASSLEARIPERPTPVDCPDLDKAKEALQAVRNENDAAKSRWVSKNQDHRERIIEDNNDIRAAKDNVAAAERTIDALAQTCGRTIPGCGDTYGKFIDIDGLNSLIDSSKRLITEEMELTNIPWPVSINETDFRAAFETAEAQMTAFHKYEAAKSDRDMAIEMADNAKEELRLWQADLDCIKEEKQAMIESATLPDGFAFSNDGLLYNGFQLLKSEQSSSALVIAALKLALLSMGEVRTMCFDAATLDNQSLRAVNQWAEENDLQLLIEIPSREDDEKIRYEFLEGGK